jgi:hypothetical protein
MALTLTGWLWFRIVDSVGRLSWGSSDRGVENDQCHDSG